MNNLRPLIAIELLFKRKSFTFIEALLHICTERFSSARRRKQTSSPWKQRLRCLMVTVKSLTTHSCSSPHVYSLLLSPDLNSCWGFFLILFLLASSKSSFGKLTSSLRPPITQRYPVGSNAHHNRYT